MPLPTARIFAPLCLMAAMLPGCVGGTLSNHADIEMLPLRAASESEAKDLKRCLKNVQLAQENRKKNTGKYANRTKDLPIKQYCDDIVVTQGATPTGYEIRGEIREDDSLVRWTVNEKGVIEELLDPEDEMDLEF